jgi:ferrous iron transport protein B
MSAVVAERTPTEKGAVQQIAAPGFRIDYGPDLEAALAEVTANLADITPAATLPLRWTALKLLEGDEAIAMQVAALPGGQAVVSTAAAAAAELSVVCGDDVDMLVADQRYGAINAIVREVVQRPKNEAPTRTQRIDDVVTHRWLGLPIFFAIMYIVFRLVIDVAQPFLAWADFVITGPVANWLAAGLTALNAPTWLQSLAIGGVLAGVGGVLVFVPGLVILYFFLALLEDSGYMSRAAFVMDRFMRVIGLHGKSFIPMILGFGCAVPAIYATRTIAGRRDRILTGLLVPLMSCSARLPVYVVFGMALFGARAGLVIWALYALGIVVAILAGMVLTRTLLKPDATSAFVLELPPYRRPSLKSTLIHVGERTGEFLRSAGTVILLMSVVLWLLLNLPLGVQTQRDSYFGRVSASIAPVFAPLGFGTWQATGALVTGFAAKEVVVSTLSTIYAGDALDSAEPIVEPIQWGEDARAITFGLGTALVDSGRALLTIIPGVRMPADAEPADTRLSATLRETFTPLAALAFLVFVLLYVPCVATLAAIRSEYGGRWALLAAVYQTTTAWLLALLVYQGGRLLGWM